MLKAVRSRLTYANVIATIALFLALGGGAYALTGIPDRGGVYHGCVDPKTSVLRVVKAASACRKAKTVKQGTRRIRIPGESAIAWNQQGRSGQNGLNGAPGQPGEPGQPGTAVAFARVNAFSGNTRTLDTGRSHNILGVTPACFDNTPGGCEGHIPNKTCFNLGFKARNAVASVEGDLTSGNQSSVVATAIVPPLAGNPGLGYCPAGFTDAVVVEFDSAGAGHSDAPFYVAFN